MTVGPTGGGKSSMLRVVRDALTLLASRGVDAPKVAPVHIHALNPKAVTMGQLYGAFDPATREWTDGVLAEIVRQCVRCEPPDLNWVLCDGPVDAIWIESMVGYGQCEPQTYSSWLSKFLIARRLTYSSPSALTRPYPPLYVPRRTRCWTTTRSCASCRARSSHCPRRCVETCPVHTCPCGICRSAV